MKRKTIYEWQREDTYDGNIKDVDGSTGMDFNCLLGCLYGALKDYGLDNRNDLEPYWEICLNRKIIYYDKNWTDEHWFYLKLVNGKFQFDLSDKFDDEIPKRFKAQVEKLNKELS
jgi:hypothetical protein